MNLYYLQSAAAVMLTFGMVIFLHESGHFILCRILGVRVERFAFGMGPEVFGVTKGETRYSICAFPLGGFVKPAGEDSPTGTGKPDEYFGQPWNRRLAIVAAGPAMNYLLAFTLFTGVVWIKGMPEPGAAAVIGNLMTGFPADRAGIELGDIITHIDDKPVANWNELSSTIHKFPGQELTLTYRRGEKVLKAKVTPKKDEASGNGVIGIMAQPIYREVGFTGAVTEGVKQCWLLTKLTVTTIASKIYRRERPDLAGPVGIVQMVSRAAHSGWEDLVFLIGLISVAIGFFNILPVPLLDGGHAAMYIWEGLSGKKVTEAVMAKANGVGIVFLVTLLLFATYSDLSRLSGERRMRKEAAAVQAKP